jgi:hypothetical protein
MTIYYVCCGCERELGPTEPNYFGRDGASCPHCGCGDLLDYGGADWAAAVGQSQRRRKGVDWRYHRRGGLSKKSLCGRRIADVGTDSFVNAYDNQLSDFSEPSYYGVCDECARKAGAGQFESESLQDLNNDDTEDNRDASEVSQ